MWTEIRIGAVCSGSTLFASILNLSVMLSNYLQQTTSADDIFRCIFFLGALRVKCFLNALSLMAFDIFYQSFVWTSAESNRQDNVIKKSIILEEIWY